MKAIVPIVKIVLGGAFGAYLLGVVAARYPLPGLRR